MKNFPLTSNQTLRFQGLQGTPDHGTAGSHQGWALSGRRQQCRGASRRCTTLPAPQPEAAAPPAPTAPPPPAGRVRRGSPPARGSPGSPRTASDPPRRPFPPFRGRAARAQRGRRLLLRRRRRGRGHVVDACARRLLPAVRAEGAGVGADVGLWAVLRGARLWKCGVSSFPSSGRSRGPRREPVLPPRSR